MHRGFAFRLYPAPAQAHTLGQWVGAARLVYNLALEQRRDFWRQYRAVEGRSISLASQSKDLTALRAEFDWIAAVPQTGLEAALNDLDKAYAAFFRGGGYPTPRRLGQNDSIRFRGREILVEQLNAKWSRIRVPKLGWVKFRRSCEIVGRLLTATVRRVNDQWFLTVSSDVGAAPDFNRLPAVGIDRGVATTLSLSTGEHIRLPDLSATEKRKRRAQRILSRRKKGSARRNLQRRRLGLISAQLRRARCHHLHVASKSIAARFGVVALEALRIRSMTASAKGAAEAPGVNVRQKAGLNRSILSQGWGIFAQQLEYKLEAAGGRLVYVPAAYTSQTCAECGVVDARSRKSQAVFDCVACDHSDHADTNAARNIMRGSTAFVEGDRLHSPVEAKTLAA